MDQESGSTRARCSVIGDAKLTQPAGGSEAVCAEIRKALAAVGHADTALVVNVRRSHLTAKVKLADGRMLPEIGFAVSDAPLSQAAIQKFALQIAAAVRGASA